MCFEEKDANEEKQSKKRRKDEEVQDGPKVI